MVDPFSASAMLVNVACAVVKGREDTVERVMVRCDYVICSLMPPDKQ